MAMIDTLISRYPLPHHQDTEFQTKDLAHLVHSEPDISGFLDQHQITQDGRLFLHKHVREWRNEPDSSLGGYLKSVRDWWEEIPGIHGDINIYTTDEGSNDGRAEWVEFRVRFTHGGVGCHAMRTGMGNFAGCNAMSSGGIEHSHLHKSSGS